MKVVERRFTLRLARRSDFASIRKIDAIAQNDRSRRNFIADAIGRRSCYVALVHSKIAGYCVFDYSFFERGFISMLVVDQNLRRNGIASALIHKVETICRTKTLFTSINESNRIMRNLLRKLGYKRSGRIDNLDEGDPELIYCKQMGVPGG